MGRLTVNQTHTLSVNPECGGEQGNRNAFKNKLKKITGLADLDIEVSL